MLTVQINHHCSLVFSVSEKLSYLSNRKERKMHKRVITVSEKVFNENRFNEVKKKKDSEEKESWFSQSFREFCSATALVYGSSCLIEIIFLTPTTTFSTVTAT